MNELNEKFEAFIVIVLIGQESEAREYLQVNVVGEDAPSTSTDAKSDDDSKRRRHCLDAFAHGTKLGRVQILKSGKARLVMGNMTLDLHLATPIDCLQVCLFCQITLRRIFCMYTLPSVYFVNALLNMRL